MKKTNIDDNQKLLNDFVELRDRYKKTNHKRTFAKYKKIMDDCVKAFDYIVEIRASRYKKFDNYEDLKQEGRIALLSALATYKPALGSFYFWAGRYIKTKLSREANKHSTIKIPLKKAKSMQPIKVTSSPESLCHSPEKFRHEQQEQQITNIISVLPKNHKRVIEILFDHGNSQKNSRALICRELKISDDECIVLVNDAKENFKNELKNRSAFFDV